ncbi:MAG TPA: phosphoglycerate dehydrogenase [Candidatus Competibacteraceae bacterium]|nr:phosphoglycerate dehydrogenase [Candidatus Competibacteraceae bacterium]HPF58556.1 phosphoglycerate dehydrogenase [Candidatus Competibacteraceae bacterium]HRY18273.1 phosphoglycerate dehydrogenase [Candidatus Competibacteraceae bacterium]
MNQTSLDKNRIKILLLEGLHTSAVEAFQADGYTNIDYRLKSLPEPQLLEAVSDAYFIGIRSATSLTARVFEHAPRLIGVGCFCIGTNQVDLDAAQERGIPVFNAPFSNTRSVAELVLAEIVLLLRGIPQRNAAAHRGGWVKTATGSHEARGKCLGIVGYGHIGTQVGLLAEALGMRVVFYDIETKLALGNAQPLLSLEALLEMADVVTLHVPETPQTCRMIGAGQLARMKPGARLINAARGTVVDIDALAAALASEQLAGAAIDVFPVEPKANEDEFVSPLRVFDNVLLTPHVGGSTEEAQQNIGLEVAGKLLKYSNNGSTLSAVNFPEVSLPEHPGKHRLLHIHRNQPGVLSQINAIFSEQQINIAGQYLQTNARIGYVVIDIDGHGRAETQQLRKRLEEVAGTLRTRILY